MRRKRNSYLFAKQGFKSIFKNKLQICILVLLTLLSSMFLSASISAYQNITGTYNSSFKDADNADYYEQTKMFYTSTQPNINHELNSFTPAYDILPSYVYMSKNSGFPDITINAKFATQYEMFFNDDKGIYGSSPNLSSDKNNNANKSEILLNPFTFLYQSNNNSWLGLTDSSIENVFQINFDSKGNATPVTNQNLMIDQFQNLADGTIKGNINTNLVKYITEYIKYEDNGTITDDVTRMNNSIFKYSLVAQYIKKNAKVLENTSTAQYQILSNVIANISQSIAYYVSYSLYKLYINYAGTFIDNWNNGGYDFPSNSKNKYEMMQDDIYKKKVIYNSQPFALPIWVNSDLNKSTKGPWFNLNDAFSYITGKRLKNKENINDNEYNSNFINPLFNKDSNGTQLYNDSSEIKYLNVDTKNFNENYNIYTDGTKGLINPIKWEVNNYNKSKYDLSPYLLNSIRTITYYSGYSDFIDNRGIYTSYEYHKYLASSISNFSLKSNLEATIESDSQTTYTLMSYQSLTNNLTTQNNMNLILYKGVMPTNKYEVVISPGYAKENHINIGSKFTIGKGVTLKVSAIGINALELYPMLDPTNPIVNISSQAIIYTTVDLIEDINSRSKNEYATTENTYWYYEGNKQNKTNDYNSLISFLSSNTQYLNYNYAMQMNYTNKKQYNKPINTYGTNDIVTFDESKIPLYEKTLFTETDKVFLILTLVVSLVILIVSLLSVIIITRNSILKDSSQIAIMKAIGIKKWNLVSCYTTFSSLIILAIPIGFVIGLFLQFLFVDNFSKIFSLPNNNLTIGWISLLISFLAVGSFTIITAIIISSKLINKSTVTLIQSNIQYKKTKMSQKIDNWFKNRKFKTRFKINLAYSSLKKLFMISGVMLFSSIAISFSLVIPAIINTVSTQYHKIENYSNSSDYDSPVFNNPISKININEWAGMNYLNANWKNAPEDDKDSYGNFKSIDDYFKLSSNNSVIPPFMMANDGNSQNWQWAGDYVFQNKKSTLDLLNNLLQGILSNSGKAMGNWTFDELLNWADKYYGGKSSPFYNQINSFLSGTIVQIFKTIWNYSGTDPNWRDQIINTLLNIMPSFVDKQLQNKSSREIFSIGWNYINWKPNDETLITKASDPIKLGKQKETDLNEIGLPKYQNDIYLTDAQKNAIYNTASIQKSLSMPASENNNSQIIVPVVATKAAAIHYGLKNGQLLPMIRKMNELQYKKDDGSYGEVDPSWWMYDGKQFYDYTGKANDGMELNPAHSTYYKGAQLGYAQFNPKNNNFSIQKYYDPSQVILRIPKSNGSIDDWPKMFSKNADPIITQDANYYYVHPFDYNNYKKNYVQNPIDAFKNPDQKAAGFLNYALLNNLMRVQNYSSQISVDKSSTVNHNQNIYMKVIGITDQYDKNIFYMDQAVTNLLMGYDINKTNFYNYMPSTQRNNTSISGTNIIFDKNNKILKSDEEPYLWFNAKLSKLSTNDWNSFFSMYDGNGNYSSYTIQKYSNTNILGSETLKEINGLIKIVTEVGLGICIPFIISIIICSIVLIILITSMFIDDNIRFMTLMRAEGYKKWEVIDYLLGIFSPIFLISFLIGYALVMAGLSIAFYIIQHIYKIAAPYEFQIWTLFVSFAITFGIYMSSIILANYRIRKFQILNITS